MGKRQLTREDTQMTNKHVKRYSTSALRDMQIKTMMIYCYLSIYWPYQMPVSMESSWNCHMLLVAMQSGTASLENSLAISYRFNIYSTDGQAISLLEKQKHTFIRKLCTWMFIAALLKIAKSRKQLTWVVWMDKLWCIHTMEYYTAGKELLETQNHLNESQKALC